MNVNRFDFDFTPLFRSLIGFDATARALENSMANQSNSYPPYNIEKTDENSYRISMAVAGFGQDDLDLTVHDNMLTVKGGRREEPRQDNHAFLHRGIAGRSFEQRFHLAEHVEVVNASIENGMLHVDLVREVPEKMKPRKIEIANAQAPTTLLGKAKSLTGKAS